MIEKYITKKGKERFKVDLYLGIDDKTGEIVRLRKGGFNTKKEAEVYASRKKYEYDQEIADIDKKRFKEVYDLWFTQYELNVKPNTYIQQLQIANKHILPEFENYYIDKIDVMQCQKIVNKWYSNYTKSANLVSITSRIFKLGIALGHCKANPMEKVSRPKNTHKVEYDSPFYKKDELNLFLKHTQENESLQDYVMFRVFAFTGLRKAELIGLTWDSIDLKHKKLKVDKVYVPTKDGHVYQEPKNNSSRRIISVDQETINLLKRWKVEQREKLFAFGLKVDDSSPVFTRSSSILPISDKYPNDVLNRIIKEGELNDITIHGFRHTHCSLLFDAGIEMSEVKDRLGHSSITTTMNIYNHVTKRKRDESADIFASFMSSL